MVNLIAFTPILLIMIGLIIFYLIKGSSGLKIMIMGIQFTLIGIGLILIHDSVTNSLGLASMFFGLIISIVGLMKKN